MERDQRKRGLVRTETRRFKRERGSCNEGYPYAKQPGESQARTSGPLAASQDWISFFSFFILCTDIRVYAMGCKPKVKGF